MKTATKKATEETFDNLHETAELSQKTADMLLKNTVQSMEIANNYFQKVIEANLEAQNAGLDAARTYYDGLAEIQKAWLNLYTANNEKSIKWYGEASASFRETVNNYVEKIEDITEQAQNQAKDSAK